MYIYVLDLLCDDETSRLDSQDLLHFDDMVGFGKSERFKSAIVRYVISCECMYVLWVDHLPSTPGQPITSWIP